MEEKLSLAYSQTLGQLREQLRDTLPQDLLSRLDTTLDQRNFLAHHFWFERAHLMFSTEGLESIINELSVLADLFGALNRDLSEFAKPRYEKLGLTEEMVEEHLREAKSGKPLDPFPDKRRPKKQERLVRAWEFTLPNGTVSLIFETEDGCLWQFCDVGLGWTYYDKIRPEWQINDKIQPYLPATINARPKDCEPWNYLFELSKGAVLWVRPGRRPKTYLWGIQKKGKGT
jgi:hypothetical protein